MTACPCCGQDVMRADPHSIASFVFVSSGTQKIFLEALVARFGRTVPYEAILEQIYSGVRNGGPASARDGLKVHASQLRKRLAPHGLAITATKGAEFGYRLHWVAA